MVVAAVGETPIDILPISPRPKVYVEWIGRATECTLPAELATSDRICQRWAVSVGMGLPSDIWLDQIASRPPPLDDGTAIVVDQIVLKSPPRTRRLTELWYRTQTPQPMLAKQLNLAGERELRLAWQIVLGYLQWKFIETKHADLLALLRFRG
jgi:hypothetical protein